MPERLRLSVNGADHDVTADRAWRLLSVLRDELDLTGAKLGCGEGECGACTVLVDGEAVRSCVATVGEVEGHAITTIEGLANDGKLHPAQQAFAEIGAMQCGFCTPGMVLSTVALLSRDSDPDDEAIRSGLNQNICRCCTYPRIERAVHRAAELARDGNRAGPSVEVGDARPVLGATPTVPWDRFKASERDYFAALSDGLVVVTPPGVVPRDRPQQPGPWYTNGGAWLHVGASGVVTAFSGKVDVGQDNRTAFAMLVAEELHVPMASVRLVQGDTDVTPYDIGTFGSRSMPDAAEYLRAGAATARDVLVGLAADRWRVTPEELLALDGRIVRRQTGQSLSYGELLEGVHQVETATIDAPVTPRTAWRVAGVSTPRVNGQAAVTGAKRFPSDFSLPGMLHGAVLRPPALGATLASVDPADAIKLPGVTVVCDGDFVGTAAADPFLARRALRAIRVEWQQSPQPVERDLEQFLRDHPIEEKGWGGEVHHQVGDVDSSLASATVRLKRAYTTAYIAHVPLETRVAVAEWSDERVTVWTGTQTPFRARAEAASALGISEDRVRIIVPSTGAAFGGKHSGQISAEAARLSRAAGKPVRVMWSREEEFRWGYFRAAAVIDIESGVNREGAITSWKLLSHNNGPAGLLGPYDIANQRVDYQATEAPLPQGPYRGVAATASHFARESHIDELANEVGADPVEFRLQNLSDDRLAAVVRAAAERAGWADRDRRLGHGMGIACGSEKGGRVATCVEVQVQADGTVHIVKIVATYDCGAVVNPDNVVNQIEGGLVMGLGGALFEAIHFEDGIIQNPRFSQYRVPRMKDVPPIDVVLLDRKDQPSFGAGETPIVAVAPAIANAIFAARGVRLRSLPLVPDGKVPG